MKRKTAQSAIEFLILMSFLFLIATFVSFIIGKMSLDLNKSNEQKEMDDFVSTIENELSIMTQANGGYYRVIQLPYRFHVDVYPGYLNVTDNDIVGKHEIYELSSSYNLRLTNTTINGKNIQSLILEKNATDDFENSLNIQ